jgi:hypothetical protein
VPIDDYRARTIAIPPLRVVVVVLEIAKCDM